jgi:uncharacterized glyoxalase superfamily protein PhnB
MLLNRIDLIVRDPKRASEFLRDALGLELLECGERFAELRAGEMSIMLSPDALVPMENAAGVILHFQVEDVAQALSRARGAGATVLAEPSRTDWGWESAMVAGPEGVVIDLYREE